jgi:hypothetical protein
MVRPDGDCSVTNRVRSGIAAASWRRSKDDQGPGVEPEPAEVAIELVEPVVKRVPRSGPPDLHLDGLALHLTVTERLAALLNCSAESMRCDAVRSSQPSDPDVHDAQDTEPAGRAFRRVCWPCGGEGSLGMSHCPF